MRLGQAVNPDFYIYGFIVIAAMTGPLQGLPNFLVYYLIPRLQKRARNRRQADKEKERAQKKEFAQQQQQQQQQQWTP